MNRVMLAGLVVIGFVGVAPFAKFWKDAPQAPQGTVDDKRPHVEVAKPVRKTITRKLKLPGDVLPDQQVAVFARVQGYLESIAVDRGSFSRGGDLLAKISVPELEKQLAKEQADLAVCGPSIVRDEATLAWRKAIWERLEKVAADVRHLVNQESLDDARGRFETAKAELDLTKARELGLRAMVEKTQAMIDFATLRAPFDGVITERWVDPGDLIQPGTTKLLHFMQVDPVRVRIHIPESDVPSVRPESRARITFDELSGKTFEAQVSRIFWALNRNTKTMAVEIDLKNPDKVLRPGMFARVEVGLDERSGALVLPASALITEKKKSFVFVVRNDVVKKVAIRVGFDDGIEFQVGEGISEQDEIVVTGKNLVADGEKVRITRKP